MEAWRDELYHHGIEGQKWGIRNGPPYPLGTDQMSRREKKLAEKATRVADRVATARAIDEADKKVGDDSFNEEEYWKTVAEEIENYKKTDDYGRIWSMAYSDVMLKDAKRRERGKRIAMNVLATIGGVGIATVATMKALG